MGIGNKRRKKTEKWIDGFHSAKKIAYMKPLHQTLAAGILLVSAFHLTAQSNIVLKIQHVADGSKFLSWNSTTNGLYTIESAETLDPSSLAQVRWVTREVQYPSQGTNTVWTDVGDPSWIPRLSYPGLSLGRFYRVTQSGSNALTPPPTITFSLYTNGIAVSTNATSVYDFLEIRYNVNPGSNLVSEILVFVDGQIIKRAGGTSTNTFINTSEWLNGTHSIWIEARVVDNADSTESGTNAPSLEGVGISSTRTVAFDNYISGYFVATPFFIPSVDGPQEIVAKFAEVSYWRLFVLQGGQTVVRVFEGTNTSLYVAWDGTRMATIGLGFPKWTLVKASLS